MTTKLTPQIIEGFVGSCLAEHFDNATQTPKFHKELWEYCCSDHELVAIAAPRGHGKSTAVGIAYLLASVLFRVNKFVMIISDTETQARDFLGDVKKELQFNDDLRNLFGIRDFKRDSETDIIVRCQDGYLFRIIAKGTGQAVRGAKWDHKRPDLIICDDMENDEMVMNDERREKVRKWFMSTLIPCRAPGGKVRVVGTILHLDSMLARMVPLEGERDTVAEGLKFTSSNKRTMFKSVLYKAHEYGNPAQIEDEETEILWPERFRKKGHYTAKEFFCREYQARVDMGTPEAYAQEFLNRPIDDSFALFRKTDFPAMRQDEKEDIASGKKPLEYYAGCDLAISEKQRADWCVFHVVGMDANGYLYHTDTIRERMDGREIVDTVIRLKRQYDIQWIAIGQDQISASVNAFLNERMLQTGTIVRVIPIPTGGKDKVLRSRGIQGRMRMGSVKFDHQAEYFHDLMTEFLQFPRGRKDDQVDAYACIGQGLDKMSVAPTFEEVAEDEYQDELRRSGAYDDGRSAETGY